MTKTVETLQKEIEHLNAEYQKYTDQIAQLRIAGSILQIRVLKGKIRKQPIMIKQLQMIQTI